MSDLDNMKIQKEKIRKINAAIDKAFNQNDINFMTLNVANYPHKISNYH